MIRKPCQAFSSAGVCDTKVGLSACVMISTAVPVAILFTFLEKHLIKGLTAGATKE